MTVDGIDGYKSDDKPDDENPIDDIRLGSLAFTIF